MIIIIGDSWGVGEWGADENNQYCLKGPGIGQYLSFYKSTINLSYPSGDNEGALTNLSNLLAQFTPTAQDEFFWIVTDPQRSVNMDQFLNTTTTLYDQLLQSLTKSLTRANEIAETHKIQIKLIGGLCDLEEQWVAPYSNLKLVVPSWGKLINQSYSTYIGFSSGPRWANVGEQVKARAPHLLEEWLNLTDRIKQKADGIEQLQGNGFGIGDSHPSRVGHQILRDFLFPMLKNLN
jgi:hypothetical protein